VTAETFGFWVPAILLVVSALAVVLSKNLFHSVLWLALALTCTAGIFLGLQAEFLAAVQLLLYAGGIVTIVVFAIVVTQKLVGERLSHTSRHLAAGGAVAVLFVALVASTIGRATLSHVRPSMTGDLTRTIGESVLTRYVLPFELLAVLMLAAMLGAVYFARPED
jgi:NADH-quinone oxidoreductase subunit J